MNPCGKIVDFGRRGYTTKARLFSDSDQEVTIRWYKVPDSNGTIRHETGIVSQDQEPMPWLIDKPCEVFGAPRVYDPRKPPLMGRTNHECGPVAWQLTGEPYDPDPPYQEYDQDGIPVCCRPKIGGVLFGGSADVLAPSGGVLFGGSARTDGLSAGGVLFGGSADVLAPSGGVLFGGSAEVGTLSTGGVLFGGSAEVGNLSTGGILFGGTASVLSPAGGVLFGGSAEVGNLSTGGILFGGTSPPPPPPPPPGPGTDCASASAQSLGTSFGGTVTSPNSDWWKISGLTPGTVYHASISPLPPLVSIGGVVSVKEGSCPSPSPVLTTADTTTTMHWTAGAATEYFVVATFGGSLTYTLTIT